jgi:DNA end-binding protein Ku
MIARAIWQGSLKIQKHALPVKLYSAVQDRQIHFHLLHRRDRTRVEQRMVDAKTGKAVPSGEARKAFEAEPGVYVTVTPEEIERSQPEPGRTVIVSRFVPVSVIDPLLYDRPYFLGPGDESPIDYFGLAQALATKKKAGVASWVMRKHSYHGILTSAYGYLVLITLRMAKQVIPSSELEPPAGPAVTAKEKDLAAKLVEELSSTFDPDLYHDQYQQRIRELIDAKRTGKKMKRKPAPPRAAGGRSLTDALEKSLRAASSRRRS